MWARGGRGSLGRRYRVALPCSRCGGRGAGAQGRGDEIADGFCINKSDNPQAKNTASEVRSILDIGQELDPDPWFPPIVMTRGNTGEGVKELKDTIQKHREFLEEDGRLAERRRAALRDFVVSWATNRLEKEMHERLNREDTELVEKVYNRELDPISASEIIFREV